MVTLYMHLQSTFTEQPSSVYVETKFTFTCGINFIIYNANFLLVIVILCEARIVSWQNHTQYSEPSVTFSFAKILYRYINYHSLFNNLPHT